MSIIWIIEHCIHLCQHVHIDRHGRHHFGVDDSFFLLTIEKNDGVNWLIKAHDGVNLGTWTRWVDTRGSGTYAYVSFIVHNFVTSWATITEPNTFMMPYAWYNTGVHSWYNTPVQGFLTSFLLTGTSTRYKYCVLSSTWFLCEKTFRHLEHHLYSYDLFTVCMYIVQVTGIFIFHFCCELKRRIL